MKREKDENRRIDFRAREFAEKAHGAQRYGSYPYVQHLEDAWVVLLEHFHLRPEHKDLYAAAFLHDCLEDTKADEAEMRRLFGNTVVDIVAAVTKRPAEPSEAYYARIRVLPNAVAVKLADRIANVEACLWDRNEEKLSKYKSQHAKFRAALRREGEHSALWERLDRLFTLSTRPPDPDPAFEFRARCSACKAPGATVAVRGFSGRWRVLVDGLFGTSGARGRNITAEKALKAKLGLSAPHSRAKVESAGFYDNAGFCLECEKFYCGRHWNISDTGYGTCPVGHGKSFDQHWRPD